MVQAPQQRQKSIRGVSHCSKPGSHGRRRRQDRLCHSPQWDAGSRNASKACSLSKRSEDVQALKQSTVERDTVRMGVPSKGRMAEDTLDLLKSCQLNCQKPNPRQYFGQIPAFPGMEVWFQRASDVVRKLRTGDLDIGIVGMDMFAEFAEEDRDLVVIHNALDFGQCKLALGVPTGGAYAQVHTLQQLKDMGWSEAQPLRVVTGYTNIARRFALRVH